MKAGCVTKLIAIFFNYTILDIEENSPVLVEKTNCGLGPSTSAPVSLRRLLPDIATKIMAIPRTKSNTAATIPPINAPPR